MQEIYIPSIEAAVLEEEVLECGWNYSPQDPKTLPSGMKEEWSKHEGCGLCTGLTSWHRCEVMDVTAWLRGSQTQMCMGITWRV